jgi:hypothetical protein
MDTTKFDSVARLFGSGMTRREALRGLVAGAAAITAGGVLIQAEDASAKRRKKSKKSKKQQNRQQDQNQDQNGGQTPFLPSGARCQNDGQCNSGQQQICEVPHNASNSDTHCCGGAGAVCGGVNSNGDAIGPFCCVGEAGVRSFVCSQNDETNPNVPGTCIPVPPGA